MNGLITMISSFFLGVCLGVFHFGGLWLTTKRLPVSRQPALLTIGSFIGRSIVCLLGFYVVAGSGLSAVLLSLAGFVLTKIIMVRHLGYKREDVK